MTKTTQNQPKKLGVKIDKAFYTCSPALSQVPQTTVEKIYAFTGQPVNIVLAIGSIQCILHMSQTLLNCKLKNENMLSKTTNPVSKI